MALESIGVVTSPSILFNTGILTINGKQLGEITNINDSQSFEGKMTYNLNSIKAPRLRRSNFTTEVTFEVEAGVYREIINVFNSSSSPVANGMQYAIKDGQQNSATVYITGYQDDDTSAATTIQVQLINPLLTQNNRTMASQEFGNVAVTIMCTDIETFVGTSITG